MWYGTLEVREDTDFQVDSDSSVLFRNLIAIFCRFTVWFLHNPWFQKKSFLISTLS